MALFTSVHSSFAIYVFVFGPHKCAYACYACSSPVEVGNLVMKKCPFAPRSTGDRERSSSERKCCTPENTPPPAAPLFYILTSPQLPRVYVAPQQTTGSPLVAPEVHRCSHHSWRALRLRFLGPLEPLALANAGFKVRSDSGNVLASGNHGAAHLVAVCVH